MTCGETREYIFAFLDNELDAALSMDVQRHLDHCPVCARECDIERTIRRQLETGLFPDDDVPEFDESGLSQLIGSHRVHENQGRMRIRRTWWMAIGGTVAAACVAAAAVLMFSLGHPDSRASGFADLLVQDMEHFVAENQPLQIVSSDAEVVSNWLKDRTALDVTMPAGDPHRATLLGGRKCKIAGETAAFAAYRFGDETISLVALAESNDVLSGMKRVERDGHTYWIDRCQGHTVVACRRGKRLCSGVAPLRGRLEALDAGFGSLGHLPFLCIGFLASLPRENGSLYIFS